MKTSFSFSAYTYAALQFVIDIFFSETVNNIIIGYNTSSINIKRLVTDVFNPNSTLGWRCI